MHDPFMNLEEEESKTHDKPTPSPSFEPFTGAEPEDVSDQITSMWEPPTPASEVSDLTRDNQSSLVSFGLNVILMATTSLVFLVGAQELSERIMSKVDTWVTMMDLFFFLDCQKTLFWSCCLI